MDSASFYLTEIEGEVLLPERGRDKTRPWRASPRRSRAPRRSRSTYRGERGGRGGYVFPSTVDATSWKLGPLVKKIEIEELSLDEQFSPIENVIFAASYNWVEGEEPVIFVPGSPPAWTPPKDPPKLRQDRGEYFRDPNAARSPEFPTEPGVRALMACNPSFDGRSINVMACGSTLGNLLRFASSIAHPFRFDVDIVGQTAFFIRKEDSPTDLLKNVKGYGHTFPEAYTQWDPEVRGSVSHQRIVQYDFGGLRVLVRFQADGYRKKDKLDASSDRKQPVVNTAESSEASSLALGASKLTLGEYTPSSKANLRLEMRGREIDQSQIFDIKTRYIHHPIDMEDVLPRLWVTQVSRFLPAYNKAGVFDKPRMQDISEDLQKWQAKASARLCRYHAIIKQVIAIVRDTEDKRAEVIWKGDGPLLICTQVEERRALPTDLSNAWAASSLIEEKQAENQS